MVSDVLHEPLGAFETAARAFAAPVGAVVEGRGGRGWRWRSGGQTPPGSNSRLHSGDAPTCERIAVHKLDGRRGLRNRRRGRQWSNVRWCANRSGQVSGRASGPASSHGQVLYQKSGSRGVRAARVVAWDRRT